jgi:hypothetical protein
MTAGDLTVGLCVRVWRPAPSASTLAAACPGRDLGDPLGFIVERRRRTRAVNAMSWDRSPSPSAVPWRPAMRSLECGSLLPLLSASKAGASSPHFGVNAMSWDRSPSPSAVPWRPSMRSLECGSLLPLLSALKAGASSPHFGVNAMSWDRSPSPGAVPWRPSMRSLECGSLLPLLSASKAGASSPHFGVNAMSWDRSPSPSAVPWRPSMRSLECGSLLPLLSASKAGASSRTPKWAESTTRGEHCLCRICATSKAARRGPRPEGSCRTATRIGFDDFGRFRKEFLAARLHDGGALHDPSGEFLSLLDRLERIDNAQQVAAGPGIRLGQATVEKQSSLQTTRVSPFLRWARA